MYLNSGVHRIKETENQGEIIVLDDDSKWKVSPYYRSKSRGWQAGDEVKVAADAGSKSRITHAGRNEFIEASFIG